MDEPTQPEVPESAPNQSNPTVVQGKRWLMDLFPNLRDAGMRWTEDDAGSLAASVAYYLALSLFPMLLLLTSGIGLFLRFTHTGKDAEQQILTTVEFYGSPAVKEHIEQLLKQLSHHSIVSGPFGIVMAIMAAIGVFSQIDRGFDKIFRIAVRREKSVSKTVARVVHHRLSAFLMLVALGGLIVVLFAASVVVAQFRSLTGASMPSLKHVFNAVELITTVIANAMLFTLIYRTLPKRRVLWRDAVRGGLLVAIIWELGRDILGMFLIGMRYTTAYGVIGTFIALLLWCYYGISIIFFGAEYVQVLEVRRQARRESIPGGTLIGGASPGTVAKVLEQGETPALSSAVGGNRHTDDSGTHPGDNGNTSSRSGLIRQRTRPRRSSGETKDT